MQWLQIKMAFLLGYNLKIGIQYGGGGDPSAANKDL